MKKMNFYFNPTKVGLLCLTVLSLFAARVSAQCPALNYTVTSCTGITAAQATGIATAVWDDGTATGLTPKTLTSCSQVERYRNTATNCWNTVTLEDKTGPALTPPAAAAVLCTDANVALLLPGAPAAGFPYRGATASAGTAMAYPTLSVADCSGLQEVSYSDVVSGVTCDGGKTVTRTWRAKDNCGNVGTAAVQVIIVTRPAVAFAAPADITIACTDAVPAALTTSATVCAVTTSLLSETRVNLCGNTYKLVRVYQVVDACPAGVPGMVMQTATQTITVTDVVTPKLTVSGTSYITATNAYYRICNADYYGRKVNATDITSSAGGDVANTNNFSIVAWGDATMCGAGRFSLNVGSTDNCVNGSITTSDSRYPVVNGVISGTVMGASTTFNVTATDACGNTSTVTVTVIVEDNISPTAICDGVTATLNNYKQAVITGASFNNASNDNCGITRILVAKAVGTALPTDWCTSVTFECADLAATGLKVWVRYLDAAGNFTDCCVPVSIVDKGTLTCANRGTVTRVCTDASLTNLDGLFSQPAFFYDGCSTPTVTSSTNNSGITCGAGTIVRTFTFTITNSLGTQTAVCTQGISVVASRGFRVRPLADTTAVCAGTYNLEANRQQVIRNLQLLYATPIDGPGTTGSLISNPSDYARFAYGNGSIQFYTNLFSRTGTSRTLNADGTLSALPVPNAILPGTYSFNPSGIAILYPLTNPILTGGSSANVAGPHAAGPNVAGYVPTIANVLNNFAGPYTGITQTNSNGNLTQRINATQEMIAGYPSCAAPVVEASDWVYSNSEFCKIYVQVFTIKDICVTSSDNTANNLGAFISNNGTIRVPTLGTNSLTDTLYSPFSNGIVQSVDNGTGGHIIRFTRLYKIFDRTAPTSTAPADIAICDGAAGDTDTDNCEFGFTRTISGTDNCGATASGSALVYTWSIANSANATILTGTGATVGMNNLAFGSYKVTYRVADLCGNISGEYTFNVSGADCKAPEILVHDKIVALAGQTGVPATGMARLTYRDIRNRITDNCTPDLTNSNKIVLERGGAGAPQPTSPASTTGNSGDNEGIMFGCADLGNQSVRVWAVDGSGNWNFAVSTITVQDNDGICAARPVIAGTIGTEAGAPVKDVVVSANANGIVAASASSAAAGTYQVTGLTAGTNYQVRAAKTLDNDKKNGVTTLDIALISKHLLAETELNSAYKIIAADVDKNGEVDATDMLHIRRFILSITSNLPAGSAWRFVNKDYAFRNAANPLGEDFPEVVSLANVPVGTNAANFTAVKLGDVNNSFDATTVRGSRVLAFSTEDMAITAGNEYTVAIAAENMNAAAFQGTFSFDGAKVKAVKAGSLNNVTDNNFNMTANAVAASWNGKSEASATVANITFVATKSGKLSEMLTVNSALTMAEGYDAAGNAMNVTLKFNTGKVVGGEFALYQNTPNPVATSTKIGFNLPKDGQAKLTIYTAEGKVLSVTNNNYKAGYNEVTVNKSDLNASGMLYYRLDTQDNSSTRKMIVIE